MEALEEEREKQTVLRRNIMGGSVRPATVPFVCTEERFFDPLQGQTTGRVGTQKSMERLGNLNPGMYTIHPNTDTFGFDERSRATTFSRSGRPFDEQHTFKFHEGLGPYIASSEQQTLGPGQYDPPTDILCSSLGVADHAGNVKSHFMNKKTPAYRSNRHLATDAHATVMGQALSKDKPQDNALGQTITSLPTKQHPSITSRFGAEKDSLMQERSMTIGQRPSTVPYGSSSSRPGRSGSRGGFQPGLGSGTSLMNGDPSQSNFGTYSSGADGGDFQTRMGAAGARSVVGMPGQERSTIIDISNTVNMVPKVCVCTEKKGTKKTKMCFIYSCSILFYFILCSCLCPVETNRTVF